MDPKQYREYVGKVEAVKTETAQKKAELKAKANKRRERLQTQAMRAGESVVTALSHEAYMERLSTAVERGYGLDKAINPDRQPYHTVQPRLELEQAADQPPVLLEFWFSKYDERGKAPELRAQVVYSIGISEHDTALFFNAESHPFGQRELSPAEAYAADPVGMTNTLLEVETALKIAEDHVASRVTAQA